MAADRASWPLNRAADLGVSIAGLSDETIEQLNKVLPATWSHNNPVDIIGDATPQRLAMR